MIVRFGAVTIVW